MFVRGDSPIDVVAESAAQWAVLAAGCERDHACLEVLNASQARALAAQVAALGQVRAAGGHGQLADELPPVSSPVPHERQDHDRLPAALGGLALADLVEFNPRVKAAIDDWLTWKRRDLIEAAENYQFLRPQVAHYYRAAGLPEALLFGIMAKESLGRVHAYSSAGAAGPLQFMPATARRFGLGMRDGLDERLDPVAATRANVRYLSEQFRILGAELELVLAAYNSGENRVRRLVNRHPGKRFWDAEIYYALPAETRDYVPMVLAAAWLFLHHEDYGLELPERSVALVEIALARDSSLGELTICLGHSGDGRDGWFRMLRNLNPVLKPEKRIAAGQTIVLPDALATAYQHQCQDNPLVRKAEQLHLANYPPEGQPSIYLVEDGDTLFSIARRSSCASVEAIAKANQLRAPRYALKLGQRLTIPGCS